MSDLVVYVLDRLRLSFLAQRASQKKRLRLVEAPPQQVLHKLVSWVVSDCIHSLSFAQHPDISYDRSMPDQPHARDPLSLG